MLTPGDRGALLEVVFRIEIVEDMIEVRAVVFRQFDSLSGWLTDPGAWGNAASAWPVVDI